MRGAVPGLNGWPDETGDWTGHCGSYPRVQGGGVSSAGLLGDSLGLWNLAGVCWMDRLTAGLVRS